METLPRIRWNEADGCISLNKNDELCPTSIRQQAIAENHFYSCGHIEPIFSQEKRKIIVKDTVKTLRKHSKHFTAIAVSGYSSSLFGSIVAEKLNKNLILVRKDSEIRRSTFLVEGRCNQDYVFIDDLIDSGCTLQRVYKRVSDYLGGRLYGVYYYNTKFGLSDLIYQTHRIVPSTVKVMKYEEERIL